MMAEGYATVATASGMFEAEILRSLLESRELTVWLRHESAGTAVGLGVGPLAQVEVCVPIEQEPAAERLLDDYFAGRLATENEESD